MLLEDGIQDAIRSGDPQEMIHGQDPNTTLLTHNSRKRDTALRAHFLSRVDDWLMHTQVPKTR